MSEYDLSYYRTEVEKLAIEIQRKMVILGIDWNSESAMRELASRVLMTGHDSDKESDKHRAIAWAELRGLIGLMNTVMAESADKNFEVHGGECWKAIAKALWTAKGDSSR
jgi:hypothetical protein